jgi:hypothetical protein
MRLVFRGVLVFAAVALLAAHMFRTGDLPDWRVLAGAAAIILYAIFRFMPRRRRDPEDRTEDYGFHLDEGGNQSAGKRDA